MCTTISFIKIFGGEMHCQLPIVWQGYGKKKKSRHKKYHIICEFVDVEIREFDAIEAPISVQTSDMTVRYFEKSHWYPLSEQNSISLPDFGDKRHDQILANLTKTRQDLKSPILTRKPLSPESSGDYYYNEYAHDILTIDDLSDLEPENRNWAVTNCLDRVKSIILIDGYIWHKAGSPVLYVSSEYQNAGKWAARIKLMPIDAVERNFIHQTKGDAMFSLETEADLIHDMFPEVEQIKLPNLKILMSNLFDESVTEINFVHRIRERLDNWWMHISRQRSSEDLSLDELNNFLMLLTSIQGFKFSESPSSVEKLVAAVSSVIDSGMQVEEFGQVLDVYKKIKARTDVIDFMKIAEPTA